MRRYTNHGWISIHKGYELGVVTSAKKCSVEKCKTMLYFADNGCPECGIEFLPLQCKEDCPIQSRVCSKHNDTFRCINCTKKRKIKK